MSLPAFAGKAADTFPNAARDLRNTPSYHYFRSDDGTRLNYSVIEGPAGNLNPIVISQGKGESVFRYVEIAKEMGYGPIYILDHRGQGFSEKALKEAVHVENFQTYVDDFIRFNEGPVKADLIKRGFKGKPFIMAHSMGSAIADLALREKPGLASRVAHISPMFGLELSGLLTRLKNKPVIYLSKALQGVGLGELRFGPSIHGHHSRLTSSDRERIFTSYAIEREFGIRVPKASASWVGAAAETSFRIAEADKPKIPTIIFRGEYEAIVSKTAMFDYACSAENCKLVDLPGGHVLHQERDPVRKLLVEQLKAFYEGRDIPPPGPSCERWYKLIKP